MMANGSLDQYPVAVLGGPDHVDVVVGIQDACDPVADDGVIVAEDDAYAARTGHAPILPSSG